MKKISLISLFSVIVLNAMAQENTVTELSALYGDEPVAAINADVPVANSALDVVESDEKINAQQNASGVSENKVADNTKTKAIVDESAPVADSVQYESIPLNPETKFPHGLQLGIGVSPTGGLNGFVGYNNKNFDSFWAKRFGVRFDFATYSPIKNKLNRKINDSVGDKGVEIDDNLKIDNLAIDAKHYGAIIDFYPFGDTWFLGGWRVSGGYFTGKLDVNADVHGNLSGERFEFDLGGEKYYYDGSDARGSAKLNWKYRGPYLGTGVDLGLVAGFKLYVDAGVVFADKSGKIDLDVPLDNLKHQIDDTNVTESELNTAKAKALNDAQNKLDDYPYFPIVKLGFMYRF